MGILCWRRRSRVPLQYFFKVAYEPHNHRRWTDRPTTCSQQNACTQIVSRRSRYRAVFETTHFISAACRENLRTVETAAKIGELRNLTDRRRGVGLSERCARSMRHLISGHGKRSQQFSSYNGRIHQRGLKTCKRDTIND